jgi:hypothetical protein
VRKVVVLDGVTAGATTFANSLECMSFISKCSVIFIDEFSMLHNRNFVIVLPRIMKAQGLKCTSDVLLHNLIVLVGDHAQLPPVCACSDSFKEKKHIGDQRRWCVSHASHILKLILQASPQNGPLL